ncbi:VOC family protein [Aquimarina sp. ERC-38]|uniref:VOC family protein n=1 Tax=Aquimarina sp. ERC-38 TaxID=2949996 RepID=UPI002245BD8A|nr:VOC family protein [Aquimarina sp. ERC-38]UZO80088.1 VOC family protein [Aquimarina sp. ERC-38]
MTRSVQHIGIPVSNLVKSIEFYKEFLGGKILFQNEMVGEGFSKGTKVPNAACKFAMIEIKNTIIELIEYTNPIGKPFRQNNNDVGAIHIAFEVDDIQETYKNLSEKGYQFNAEPYTFKEKDKAEDIVGASFAYLNDPDGIQLEIFESAK